MQQANIPSQLERVSYFLSKSFLGLGHHGMLQIFLSPKKRTPLGILEAIALLSHDGVLDGFYFALNIDRSNGAH